MRPSPDGVNLPVEEADVVVFGAGAGGMTAALVAAMEGLSVILCEASSQVGGTSATSAGTIWIPGNHQSVKAGYTDTEAQGLRYLEALPGHAADRERREAYVSFGPNAIDYLEQRTDVKFSPAGVHPDYIDLEGAAKAGRALVAMPFDGRQLGDDFARVRPPIGEFLVMGGMMVGKRDLAHLLNRYRSVASFVHTAKLVARYALDRLSYRRGTRLVMGNALVARLFASLRKAGVDIKFDTALTSLERQDGRVTGAWIENAGKARLLRARKGVVLATGGLSNHPALRPQALPPAWRDVPSIVFSGNKGVGVSAALQAGANLAGTGMIWTPVSRTPPGKGRCGYFPHLFLDRAKPGLISVNSLGLRFVNEAASYHDFCEGMLRSQGSVESTPSWLICDAVFIRRYGLGLIPPGTTDTGKFLESGYVHCAETLNALAAKIGVEPVGMAKSVEMNNMYAQTGTDLEFGRGTVELNRFNGDERNVPNPCLGPISVAPYYAMAVWPADLAARRGLATNANGAVLADGGKEIDGLYACGCDMASILGDAYPGPGTSLGPAVVFGYLVGKHLSASAVPQSTDISPSVVAA